MTSPRFLIAKYAPDLRRMEPRNFGVIAWTPGSTKARFLGERAPGKVYPPSMVLKDTRHAYREWITYWRMQLAKESLRLKSGAVVDKWSAKFVDVLREKSKEHFMLVDGGVILEDVGADELDGLVDELFSELVEVDGSAGIQAEADALSLACRSIFSATKLRDRPDYRAGSPVLKRVHGVLREFLVDYQFGDVGRPSSIYQKILLGRHQSVDSAAFMFDALSMPKNKAVAFISRSKLPAEPRAGDRAEQSYKMLDRMVTVIDVDDPTAPERVVSIAESNGYHP